MTDAPEYAARVQAALWMNQAKSESHRDRRRALICLNNAARWIADGDGPLFNKGGEAMKHWGFA